LKVNTILVPTEFPVYPSAGLKIKISGEEETDIPLNPLPSPKNASAVTVLLVPSIVTLPVPTVRIPVTLALPFTTKSSVKVVAEPTTALVDILKDPSVTVPLGIVLIGTAGPKETPEKLKPLTGAVEKIRLLPETE
jgi:hypothetical protein